MKIVSRKGRKLPIAPTKGTWPFPTGKPVPGTPPPDALVDEEEELSGQDAEVIRRTAKDVDINYGEFGDDDDRGDDGYFESG